MLQRCQHTAMGCSAVTSIVQKPEESSQREFPPLGERPPKSPPMSLPDAQTQNPSPQSRVNEGAAQRRVARIRAHSAPPATPQRQVARIRSRSVDRRERRNMPPNTTHSDVPPTEKTLRRQRLRKLPHYRRPSRSCGWGNCAQLQWRQRLRQRSPPRRRRTMFHKLQVTRSKAPRPRTSLISRLN